MVRRTKEEAQETRTRLLDTAEELFQRKGLSRTSLHEIAEAAGLTRGAVYWHFKDKAELFNAMMDRATLPFEQTRTASTDELRTDPVGWLRRNMMTVLEITAGDAQLRRVFEIALHKVEYVDGQEALRDRHLVERHRCTLETEMALRQAMELGLVHTTSSPRTLALGLFALLDGLLRNWLLDPSAFDLVEVGASAIDIHLTGLGCDTAEPAALKP